MIGLQLQRTKQRCQCRTGHIPTSVTEYYTTNRRRDKCQCHKLPDVARTYNDDKIGREAPPYRTKQRRVPLHAHTKQHDEETHHHHE